MDTESFLAAMRVLAGGVVMVTARAEDRVWGLTISSCCSISAGPPQILISLDHGASARPVVLETRRFGVSILRGHQKPLAELGAVPGGPKHVDAFCERRGEATATMLAGALVPPRLPGGAGVRGQRPHADRRGRRDGDRRRGRRATISAALSSTSTAPSSTLGGAIA